MRNWQNLTHLFDQEEICEEMKKKYQGSILGITIPSGKTVYAVYQRFMDGFHLFKDMDGVTLRLEHNTDCNVFIAFPEKGLYNTPTGMVYFRRLPYRQYRKGITEENSCASDVLIEILTGGRAYNGVMKNVKHILEAQYPIHIDAALEMLQGMPSVALNRDFGFSHPYTEDKHFFLYYLNNVIGFVRDKEIVIKNHVFFQEVLDARCFADYKIVKE
jgi:hypothetical protein